MSEYLYIKSMSYLFILFPLLYMSISGFEISSFIIGLIGSIMNLNIETLEYDINEHRTKTKA